MVVVDAPVCATVVAAPILKLWVLNASGGYWALRSR